MKIGPNLEVGNQRGRSQPFVQDQIRDFRRVEIVGCNGIVDRQGVDSFKLYVLGVPIERVLFKVNPVVKAPFFEKEGTIVHQMLWFNPVIPVFFDRRKMNREKRSEGTEIEKVRNWSF